MISFGGGGGSSSGDKAKAVERVKAWVEYSARGVAATEDDDDKDDEIGFSVMVSELMCESHSVLSDLISLIMTGRLTRSLLGTPPPPPTTPTQARRPAVRRSRP